MTKEQLIIGNVYSIYFLANPANAFPRLMLEQLKNNTAIFINKNGEEVHFLFKELAMLSITEVPL